MSRKRHEEARKAHIAQAQADAGTVQWSDMPPTSQPVFCINCEHHSVQFTRHMCDAAVSLVTGSEMLVDCPAMRLTTGQCGPSGKLFTQRP